MDDLRVTSTVVIPAAELTWRFSRSSGAGGQHVNTTDSRVELTWDLAASAALDETQRARARHRLAGALVDGTITVTASERRSQRRNRDEALDRLAALVATAIAPPPPPRRPTRPSKAARQRQREQKQRRSETKRLRAAPTETLDQVDSRSRTRSVGRPMIAVSAVTTSGRCSSWGWRTSTSITPSAVATSSAVIPSSDQASRRTSRTTGPPAWR